MKMIWVSVLKRFWGQQQQQKCLPLNPSWILKTSYLDPKELNDFCWFMGLEYEVLFTMSTIKIYIRQCEGMCTSEEIQIGVKLLSLIKLKSILLQTLCFTQVFKCISMARVLKSGKKSRKTSISPFWVTVWICRGDKGTKLLQVQLSSRLQRKQIFCNLGKTARKLQDWTFKWDIGVAMTKYTLI